MRMFAALVLATFAGGLALAAGGRSGKVVRVEHHKREVFVPAGAFWMGVVQDDIDVVVELCQQHFELTEQYPMPGRSVPLCEGYREELERMRQRRVFLSAFAIDRHEVTVADFRECITQGTCSFDPLVAGDERYIRDEWPMVNVTWFEAQEYCRWRGGRLPTEAEWERAARGADATNDPEEIDRERASYMVWPWCHDHRDPARCVERKLDFNHGQPRVQAMREIERSLVELYLMGDPDDLDGHLLLAPPGTYPWSEGPYGTRDQAGNVAEWVADARGTRDAELGYRGLPGCADHDGEVTCVNPRRDGHDRDLRVVRGGSWRQPTFLARSNVRDPFGQFLHDPRRRFAHVGFRCARSL